jgi:hypothetical protein
MEFVDSTTLIIGDIAQYFFDNAVIEQIQDITRTVHSPQKESEPLIKKDRPWERVLNLTVNGWTILRDSASGEFKCWYDDFPVDPQEVARWKTIYCVSSCTCYARSSDGLKWEKPELDYCDVDGRKTNIVIGYKPPFTKLDATTVFEDSLEPDPEKRFKMLLTRHLRAEDRTEEELASTLNLKPGFDASSDEIRIEMHYSRDGIQWKPSGELPRYGQHGNGLGDAYTFFIDEDTGIYRFLTRAAGMQSVHHDKRRPKTNSFFPPLYPGDESRMNKRRVFQSESKDLIHWSRPKSVLTPDAMEDNLDDSYYGMVQFKMGEIYVGMVNVLHQVSNTMDVRLVYSRDGWKWHYLNQRQPWLTTSADSWDKNMVNIASPPVQVDDELYVFYGGSSCHHDWWITGLYENLCVPEAHDLDMAQFCIGLSKIRLDGFVSVDAQNVREGVMVTRALWTNSKKLELNAACGEGGYVDVEVTDVDENVLEGFSRGDCDTFTGNSVKTTITWNGKTEIPHQDYLRLRFFMRDASLYSFKFAL